MAEWMANGRLMDVIVLLVIMEWVVFAAWHRHSGKGLSGRQLFPNLAAGLFLMLALRAVLTDAGWPWAALFLALSGIAHVADLWCRWPRRPV
jgi:hypothetical protein